MAILWVRNQSGAESQIEKGSQTFREEYLVRCSSPTESRTAIILSGRLPFYGSAHPENPFALCTKVNPVQTKEDPCLWRVTCEWAMRTGNRDPEDDQKQPDLRRPKWAFAFVPMPQELMQDYDGKLFVDTAGTFFSPPKAITIYADRVTVDRYQAACNRAFDLYYTNATNDDTWLGAAPGEAFIVDITAREVFEFGSYWFAYHYEILVSPKRIISEDNPALVGGFDPVRVLNAGPKMIDWTDPDNPKAVPIAEGGYVDGQARPLDADGVPIALSPAGGFASEPIFLEFSVVKRRPFAALNLIPPWLW